jgi:Exopolyphosphatase
MTPQQRGQVPGLNPQRADIILAGLAVTAELLLRIEAREVKVSAFGLREGLLLEMVGAEAAPPRMTRSA